MEQKEILLQMRIQELGKQIAPIEFPQATGHESLEELERIEAEERFQRALCTRIWWNLTAEERAVIRSKIIAANSYYQKHPTGMILQSDCIEEVQRHYMDQYTLAK